MTTPIIVHLIHGTWPEGPGVSLRRRLQPGLAYTDEAGDACWFQTRHRFRVGLTTALQAAGFVPEVRAFVWSGANAFAARTQAAEEFAPHLVQGIRDGVRQLVVGHSHGGTVAMLALRQLASEAAPGSVAHDETVFWLPGRRLSANRLDIPAEAIVSLAPAVVRQGVPAIELVTLATPFLRVERFAQSRSLGAAFTVCALLAFVTAALYVARRFGQDVAYVAMFVGSVAIGLLARLVRRSRDVVEGTWLDAQAHRFVGKRIQCIRGVSDEAALTISAGIVGCNLVRALLVLAGSLFARTPVGLALTGCAGLLGLLTWDVVAAPGSAVVAWSYLLGALAGGLILLLAIASSLQSLLGLELAIGGFQWLTTVESSPDARRDQIEISTLVDGSERAAGLRHAVYLHPDCVAQIVQGVVSASAASTSG